MADTQRNYIEPTQEAGRAMVMRKIPGAVVMLNLLKFRAVADYSRSPQLAPAAPITGAAAYRLYADYTLPYLQKSGGEMIFLGRGGAFLIGPSDETWDAVMLVRQRSVEAFMAFASDKGYLAGVGHRTAALEDSRLLPIAEELPEDVFV